MKQPTTINTTINITGILVHTQQLQTRRRPVLTSSRENSTYTAVRTLERASDNATGYIISFVSSVLHPICRLLSTRCPRTPIPEVRTKPATYNILIAALTINTILLILHYTTTAAVSFCWYGMMLSGLKALLFALGELQQSFVPALPLVSCRIHY